MEAEIRPEPTPEEHEAVRAALDAPPPDAPPPAYTSGWRAAGLVFDAD